MKSATRRIGTLCLLAALTGSPAAAIDFSESPAPAAATCSPYGVGPTEGWTLPDLNKVYRVPTSGKAVECDVRNMTISAVGIGQLRDVNDPGQRNLPYGEAVEPLITELKARGLAHLQAQEALGEAKQPFKILVFAHGGLTSQAQAVQMAQRLAPAMLTDGYAPIFLVWNSDFPRAYWDRLCCVRDGEEDKSFAAVAAPSRLLSDLATSIVRAPLNVGGFLIRGIESRNESSSKYYLQTGEAQTLCSKLSSDPRRLEECLAKLVVPADNGSATPPMDEVAHLLPQVVPFRLLASATLTEPGAKSWDNMVRRTRMAFQIELTQPQPCAYPADQTFSQGGFAPLFQRLECEIVPARAAVPPSVEIPTGLPAVPAKFKLDNGLSVPVELHFYGHSMGALVGNELLDRHPNLPWKKVVYMAAASSIRDFRVTASRTVAGYEDREFHNLVLHPLNEGTSREMGGLVPQGTLLEWIDELFEGPRSPDERMMGKWNNFRDGLPLLQPALRDRTHVRVFPRDAKLWAVECALPPQAPAKIDSEVGATREGLAQERCHPIRHGEFNEFSFWRSSFLQGPEGPNIVRPRP